jgi:hypothetical protein
VSAAASATNQNAWIGYMKQELTKYPKMKLVATVYGNDDPTTATQVTQGLFEQYPNLKGIISPTTDSVRSRSARTRPSCSVPPTPSTPRTSTSSTSDPTPNDRGSLLPL